MSRIAEVGLILEEHFAKHHQVVHYTHLLGSSEKTLSRNCQMIAGTSAMYLISYKVILQGRRLLTHTHLPIATIADTLGYDEATNFVKYFRREVGHSPGSFRQQRPAR